MRKRTKGQSSGEKWWEAAEEVPRAGIPTEKRLKRRYNWWRGYAWTAVVLLPVLILSTIVLIGSNAAPAPEQKRVADDYADTRPVAVLAVQSWLAEDPAPVPQGQVVAWESATTESWSPSADDKSPGQGPFRIERHRVAISAAGTMMTAVVGLVVDPGHGPVVSGSPALLPGEPSDETWNPGEYPDLQQTSATPEVETSISQWLAAYSSGDPGLLRQVVGDADAGHSYVPLVGARLREPLLEAAWVRSGPVQSPTSLIVRVTAHIDWAVAPIERAQDAPEVTFDLLVVGTDGASPLVVAWGGVGDGWSLKKYQNAVTERAVTVPATTATFEAEVTDEPSAPVTPDVTGTPEAADSSTAKPSTKPTGGKKR